MQLTPIINGNEVEEVLNSILKRIHRDGPVQISDFETLAYAKKFQQEKFSQFEKRLVYILGLFYKTTEPTDFIEEIYSILADTILDTTGVRFTPVQADAFKRIRDNIYFSFSAPTSAGKSFLFRRIISQSAGDIVIVVPSRALIAEYTYILNGLVEKDVMVLQFVEIVNIIRTKKRIFVITPERGVDLFKNVSKLNIDLFLFDEAQISEEHIRGMRFDAFVRRVDRVLPQSKKVFTHPFILNPEAQLRKHDFRNLADSVCYKQNTVGKIFLSKTKNGFTYFSPYQVAEKEEYIHTEEDIVEDTLNNGGTVLIYTSKSKIYDGNFRLDFAKYVELCEIITVPDALKYIEQLREYIGASTKGKEKHSTLIEMMERGIVIHHGSIPLKGRLIIENFVNANYAKICFSTATLIQGINMPFDIVWINNFNFTGSTAQKNLNLKNLIGRAGRSTQAENSFDYGYVVVEEKNVPTFKSRMRDAATIAETSQLDENIRQVDTDLIDIVEAIRENSFNDVLQLTEKQVERIRDHASDGDIKLILDHLLEDGIAISGKAYYNLGDSLRKRIKEAFQRIYVSHLRRQDLTKNEKAILSAAIPLLLWQIQGKSFKEIVSLRYAFLSQKDEQRAISTRVRKGEIPASEGAAQRKELTIRYSPMAAPLPDHNVSAAGLFKRGTSVEDFDYDILVYDTYDYLDKVIGLSLMDPICAALGIYFAKTQDRRASWMANYIRYGTNDSKEIWLLKYGFSFDEVEWLVNYVDSVDENQIVFVGNLDGLTPEQLSVIERFR